MTSSPPGLYLHIPWCAARCNYCDFNTYVTSENLLKQQYQAALQREIRETGAALERPDLDTVYIGGGTPTTLSPKQLVELVETVKEAFTLRPEAEVTVEANPGTLSSDYLRQLRQGGFNRLSLGVQSFNNKALSFLSRLHNADTARRAVEQARSAGFDNLSLDLIFNLPGQTVPEWQFSLQEALKLSPEHLSLYSLIVEPGTPLHRQVSRGQVPPPDDDIGADMYAYSVDSLDAAGYTHYEISNWARNEQEPAWQTPRLASVHNLIYWRNRPYLGLGAGAVSTVVSRPGIWKEAGVWRWTNVKQPQAYISRVQAGTGLASARADSSLEHIDRNTAMTEHLLLGLRLVQEGVSAADFAARFDRSLAECYPDAIAGGIRRGLIEWLAAPDGPHLRLTRQGRFLANQAILPFID